MQSALVLLYCAFGSVVAGISLPGSTQFASPVPLRIMPLGASVTYGVGSTTGSSYRKDLRDLLIAANQTVNFVGTHENGNFTDNDVEATSGFVISQIADAAATAVPKFLPNIVLVDAGSNNCNQGGTVPGAGLQINALVDDIMERSPGVTVLLATIIINTVPEQEACRVDINRQYELYVAQEGRAQQDRKKLLLANMTSPRGPTMYDLADGRHPNDVGYAKMAKMAKIWFDGIQRAIALRFVTARVENGIPADGG
ncbi:SGNH hydrolase-type esterase domain-containing protein [Coniochaeta sp. 2T2.1]|nr:SGNH hydrolase-type esterase domain-containing protein [Coniochaeta sp. 2T2.1]